VEERIRPIRQAPLVTRVVHQDAVLVAVERGNALALAWYDAPQNGHLLTVLRLMRETAEHAGAKTCLMQVVVMGTPRFSDQTREEGAKMVRGSAKCTAASAHIIEIEGLAGVASRAFISTLLLIGRSRAPSKVFKEMREAAPWYVAQLATQGSVWTTGDVDALYRELKAHEPT
jgi:hypothetical protein